MEISIRKVTLPELETIYKIEENAFSPMNYPLFVIRQYYDLFSDYFLVAENEEKEIAGYVLGGINPVEKIGRYLKKNYPKIIYMIDGAQAVAHMPVDIKKIQPQFVAAGVWVRPFNNLIYLMPPYIISSDELKILTDSITHIVSNCQENI